jgi:GDPmannose 4,6-dehydratase
VVEARQGRRVLITGISGQDGPLLAEYLQQRGYVVAGLVQDLVEPSTTAVQALLPGIRLVQGDLRSSETLAAALDDVRPHQIYNLGGFSSVGRSWQKAELAADVTGMGVLRLLEAVRLVGLADVRFYQASSSEMFGHPRDMPQTELTAFHPRSPYGVAKAFAHHMTVNFRESYGMFACCGILYNHESTRRGPEFVTRKITRAAARISLGLQDELVLGNLDVRRDWGHANDYVRAMCLILEAETPDDYIIATGETHSLRDLLAVAFQRVGMNAWDGFVRQDPALLRPADVLSLAGNAQKAREALGWAPTYSFEDIVHEMVDADLAEARLEIQQHS